MPVVVAFRVVGCVLVDQFANRFHLVLGGAWASIIAYCFGSTSGSDRKTGLMAKSSPAAEPNVATAV
jgi:hypothetical protein